MRCRKNGRRTLIVIPGLEGTGEAITAAWSAASLIEAGHQVAFLASPTAASAVRTALPGARIDVLCDDVLANVHLWSNALREIHPSAILFADFVYLHLQGTVCPFPASYRWLDARGDGCELWTLDHLGLTDAKEVTLGPPNFEYVFNGPGAAPDMSTLLPCPLHDPRSNPQSPGTAIRWAPSVLRLTRSQRTELRRRLGVNNGAILVLYAVSGWARRMVGMLGIGYYDQLSKLLFDQLPNHISVIAVNDGGVFPSHQNSGPRVRNLLPVSAQAFDGLLNACDVFLTDNISSSALGRALLVGLPACVLTYGGVSEENGGAMWKGLFPFDIFPILQRGEASKLLYRTGHVDSCFIRADVAQTDLTSLFAEMVGDTSLHVNLLAEQSIYAHAVETLPSVPDLIDV
jgi:Family of unknown function (DUF6365)